MHYIGNLKERKNLDFYATQQHKMRFWSKIEFL